MGKKPEKFWNPKVQKISKELWFPTFEKDELIYDENLSNNWFPILPSFSGNDNLPSLNSGKLTKLKSPKIIAEKIRFFPSQIQKQKLTEWFGVYRWFYNRTINFCEENKKYNHMEVKKSIRNTETRKYDVPEWAKDKVPSKLISGAISDCCKAYKTCFSLLKNQQIKKFEMKFKTKKDKKQTLYIEKNCFAKDKSLFKTFGFGKLKCYNKRRSFHLNFKDYELKRDCRISYESTSKKWFIILSIDELSQFENQKLGDVSLDPGVRTFLTSYSPSSKICFDFGKNSSKRMVGLMKKQDFLRSMRDLATSKRSKKSYGRAMRCLSSKMRHLINDIHWKTISFLNKNFSRVIVGNIGSQSICMNETTFKETKRSVLNFRFFEFKQRLKNKHKDVHFIDEAFTSKTCSSCGRLNSKLGSSKVFSCSSCKYETDRDVNGARNIYLKFLGATPF